MAADDIIALLTGGPDNLEILSIVGMMGMGKTTLARKVFKDPNVQQHFKIRASVSVSLKYDRREVLLRLLSSFTLINQEMPFMTEAHLVAYIADLLEGKQYLILLDDVWEPKDWDKLKYCFPTNNKRCRVLITTRNTIVAEHASNRRPEYCLYRLDFLPLEECRKLLRLRVFQADLCPDDLATYEVQIARKCDGLPLAIVAIAGVLVKHKERVAWWKEVADSVENYISRDFEQTGRVVALMYKNLPNYLKPCFLYVGVFPWEFDIPVWKLVRMWVAEGLVHQQGNSSVEDTNIVL